jgi:hypothetical protein
MTKKTKARILFAATILSARKLSDLDWNKPNMVKGLFVDRAIEDAAFILEPLNPQRPTIVNSFSVRKS